MNLGRHHNAAPARVSGRVASPRRPWHAWGSCGTRLREPSVPVLFLPVCGHSRTARGFTLLELLLATAIFAIVILSINTVFFAALHLRNRTAAIMDEAVPLQQALAVMRKDLQNTVTPGGVLAGNFRLGGPASTLGAASTTGTGSSSGGTTAATVSGTRTGFLGNNGGSTGGGDQANSLDFFTSTGILRDDVMGSDIQEVDYLLMPSDDPEHTLGKDLVRRVTRNLLTFSSPIPEEQHLVSGIEDMQFEFHDGLQWQQTWDTTLGDLTLPRAVRVRLYMAVDPSKDTAKREPVELVVLLNSQSSTNSTDTATQSANSGGTGQ